MLELRGFDLAALSWQQSDHEPQQDSAPNLILQLLFWLLSFVIPNRTTLSSPTFKTTICFPIQQKSCKEFSVSELLFPTAHLCLKALYGFCLLLSNALP